MTYWLIEYRAQPLGFYFWGLGPVEKILLVCGNFLCVQKSCHVTFFEAPWQQRTIYNTEGLQGKFLSEFL